MEIQSLRMLLTEQDVNHLLKEHLPREYAVENPRVRIAPEGVLFSGEYPTIFVKVPFETLSQFFTTKGAEKHNREQLLGPFALRSRALAAEVAWLEAALMIARS